ncbi:MAG: hypothetical protein ABS35_36330 [Kaistia sp. SCN 65-12]|mgnify:CR=1 FL=1|nr:MAG: hypothetical protein ABS35_36330 [Kaistia sp. SCN 65-12]
MAERRFRTGIDRNTGRLLRGFDHAVQSVRVILSTRRNTRVMRLDFGSDLRKLRGENLTADNVLRAYAEMVDAVHRQEPNIRIVEVMPWRLDGRAGVIGFMLSVLHYPFGHLGDYTVREAREIGLEAGLFGGSAA